MPSKFTTHNLATRRDVREELIKLNEELPCYGYVVDFNGRENHGQLMWEHLWDDGSSGGVEILCSGTKQQLFNHIQAMRDGVRALTTMSNVFGGSSRTSWKQVCVQAKEYRAMRTTEEKEHGKHPSQRL